MGTRTRLLGYRFMSNRERLSLINALVRTTVAKKPSFAGNALPTTVRCTRRSPSVQFKLIEMAEAVWKE